MKFHLVTLGCQMNKSDRERVATIIEKMGYRWTDKEETADLLGVIACSVRQKAIDKVYTKIHQWNTWKNKKNLVTFITGCLLPADREKFLKTFDITFQISELLQFPEMLHQYGIVTPFSIRKDENFILKEEHANLHADFQTFVFDKNNKTIAGQPVLMNKPGRDISLPRV